jgi:hypothetical protein
VKDNYGPPCTILRLILFTVKKVIFELHMVEKLQVFIPNLMHGIKPSVYSLINYQNLLSNIKHLQSNTKVSIQINLKG